VTRATRVVSAIAVLREKWRRDCALPAPAKVAVRLRTLAEMFLFCEQYDMKKKYSGHRMPDSVVVYVNRVARDARCQFTGTRVTG
jgi:hypothetical protein